MTVIIGIDLGTTNSVVAVVESGKPRVVSSHPDGRTIPSVVAFHGEEVLVGQGARRLGSSNPLLAVHSAKRLMGARLADVGSPERIPQKLVGGESGESLRLDIQGKYVSPPEVAAHILRSLKQSAEEYLGEEVLEAVVTVPAYFNDDQRTATRDAGRLAGLHIRRVVNEPTAAALAFGLNRQMDQKIAVYDLGGGTFDISLLEVKKGVVNVLAVGGNTHLGGDDLTQALLELALEQIQAEHHANPAQTPEGFYRLREACEKAKIRLSDQEEVVLDLPFLQHENGEPLHVTTTLTREALEKRARALIKKTLKTCRAALMDADLEPEDFQEVLLVGGATRMPLVRREVERFFEKAPREDVDPDEVVALGAAVQAGVISGAIDTLRLVDVTPLSLGVEAHGGLTERLIARNTPVPVKHTLLFTTVEDNQDEVTVHVLQGERDLAEGNRSLGKFVLSGLPRARRGVVCVEVTFELDIDGILTVSARDRASGKEAEVTICARSGLSEQDLQRMLAEAEAARASDEKHREDVRALQEAARDLRDIEKTLEELDALFEPRERKKIQKAMALCREALDAGDRRGLEKGTRKLEKIAAQVAHRHEAS